MAARADGDAAGAERTFAALRREYPQHFLAQRAATGEREEGRGERTGAPGASPAAAEAGAADCGPRALQLLCERLRVPASLETLRRDAGTTERGTTLAGLARAARARGLKAEGVQVDRNALLALRQPAIAWVDGEHYLMLLRMDRNRVRVRDPNEEREEVISADELLRRSGGVLLLVSR